MTYKELAELYGKSPKTIWRYLRKRRTEVDELAKPYFFNGRWRKKKKLNVKQLKKIVEILDTPEGYKFVRGRFVKLNEE